MRTTRSSGIQKVLPTTAEATKESGPEEQFLINKNDYEGDVSTAGFNHEGASDSGQSAAIVSTTSLLPGNIDNQSEITKTPLKASPVPGKTSLNRRSGRAAKLDTKKNLVLTPPSKRKLGENDDSHYNTGDVANPSKRTHRPRNILATLPIKAPKPARVSRSGLACQENNTMDKPDAVGVPPVWASKRQAMAETLPYYNAYQGSTYASNKIVHGVLLDGNGTSKDVFNDQVYITRLGGGMTKALDSNFKQTGHQAISSIVEAWHQNLENKLPVVVICTQRNGKAPSKMPHHFNVLDHFQVTNVWYEIIDTHGCYMIRLEKINLASPSWWAPVTAPEPTFTGPNDFVNAEKLCKSCKTSSEEMFENGWVCLNRDCLDYFGCGLQVGPTHVPANRVYNQNFLLKRSLYTGPALNPLSPVKLTDSELQNSNLFGVEKELKGGVVCDNCQACVLRRNWSTWDCDTPDCGWKYELTQKVITIDDLKAENAAVEKSLLKRSNINHSDVTSTLNQPRAGFMVDTYKIPGSTAGSIVGTIEHWRSSDAINKHPDGPDDMLVQIQEQGCGLSRHPVRNPGLPLEMLTSHHGSNFGAYYKFGVKVKSRPFSSAPDPVLNSLSRLDWVGRQTVKLEYPSDNYMAPNEILALGYLESSQIGYHDDGEDTLGPTVTSLSLGASAVMRFRPKNLSAQQKKAGMIPVGELGAGRAKKNDYLQIKLRHGDMMVMHGCEIQNYYDHAVEPFGKLRFALTARYIVPEKLSDTDRELAFSDSQLPEKWIHHKYDGDIALAPAAATTNKDEAGIKIFHEGYDDGLVEVAHDSDGEDADTDADYNAFLNVNNF